jgi:hypothetical protein
VSYTRFYEADSDARPGKAACASCTPTSHPSSSTSSISLDYFCTLFITSYSSLAASHTLLRSRTLCDTFELHVNSMSFGWDWMPARLPTCILHIFIFVARCPGKRQVLMLISNKTCDFLSPLILTATLRSCAHTCAMCQLC